LGRASLSRMTSTNDLSGAAFSDVDGTGYPSSFIAYLDQAKQQFAAAKRPSYALLGLQPKDKVLDVGCGTGDDVREIAARVGAAGLAVGVDKSEAMIAEAQRRSAGSSLPVQFYVAEAEHLPWECDLFDACYVDRLLQHVASPEPVFQQICRVLKPRGRLVILDRDWGMVALDSSDQITTRIVLDTAAARIRNSWMGRRLYGLFKIGNLKEVRLQTHYVNMGSLETADTLLDLRMVAEHAIEARNLTRQAVDAWWKDLSLRDQLGTFLATVTLFVVSGVKS
jgi:ubiquinone/menaquinone biosynthesis C-methylase UbiE